MTRKRPSRGVDATGKSRHEAKHIRLYARIYESAAYRALSCPARCLLQELMAIYNGSNNSRLALSVRDAAERLGCSRNTPSWLFDELMAKGFVKMTGLGSFNAKGGLASEWTLTDAPVPGEALPTREYLAWSGTDFEVPRRRIRGGRNWRPKSKPRSLPECIAVTPPSARHAHRK